MADGLPPSGAAAPFPVTEADRAALAAAIHEGELVRFALALGNIPSPSGGEGAAALFVHDWLAAEGFSPRKVGATPERPNVIGQYGGRGDGAQLLFTAHLDTESPAWDPDIDDFTLRPSSVKNREWQECWLEDGVFRGYPITNDRGP